MKYSLKNRCQVCGTVINEGARNCEKHRRVQERLSGLVQRIENIDAPLSSPYAGAVYRTIIKAYNETYLRKDR